MKQTIAFCIDVSKNFVHVRAQYFVFELKQDVNEHFNLVLDHAEHEGVLQSAITLDNHLLFYVFDFLEQSDIVCNHFFKVFI